MLRIIGGKHRGRKIARPPEPITRPTMDRVRESIFNILSHGTWGQRRNAIQDAIVLDAFAGSGALGLECLSQGARTAYFFDKNAAPLKIIRTNIQALGEDERCHIMFADAVCPPRAREAANLVLLDPPFGHDLVSKCLPPLLRTGWIADDAVMVAEIESDRTFTLPPELSILKHKLYGTTQVFFMMRACWY